MFEPLGKLFHGNRQKVCHALTVFQRVTRDDLQRLDAAHAAGDWTDVGRLMHKMKSGCMQIGEVAAVDALSGVEHELGASRRNGQLEATFARARNEMDRVQERVAGYLETEHDRC
ncbi:Hpt domain-containing protein [Lysobacter tyrosinilyticus]